MTPKWQCGVPFLTLVCWVHTFFEEDGVTVTVNSDRYCAMLQISSSLSWAKISVMNMVLIMCGFSKMAQQPIHLVVPFISQRNVSWTCYLLAWWYRVAATSPDLTPCDFFSGATSKQRFTNNAPKLWKLWRRRYDRKFLPLHLKWFSRSWANTERGYISVSIFKAATWVMFCSKHVNVKRHCVLSRNKKKTFAVSSLVLNLLASQIGEFFPPHPVYI